MGQEPLTNESELIDCARAGDRASFCALAERYERRVYTLALHYCRDPHDAEDLSQEVWLRAARALTEFRAESSFYTWLRRITIHTFLNHRRARTVKHADETTTARWLELDAAALDAHATPAHDAEDALHDRLLVAQVFGALAELPAQQRLIFLLKHHEGMTYEEIAIELNCAPGTVKKALFRAVVKLRARLCVEPDFFGVT